MPNPVTARATRAPSSTPAPTALPRIGSLPRGPTSARSRRFPTSHARASPSPGDPADHLAVSPARRSASTPTCVSNGRPAARTRAAVPRIGSLRLSRAWPPEPRIGSLLEPGVWRPGAPRIGSLRASRVCACASHIASFSPRDDRRTPRRLRRRLGPHRQPLGRPPAQHYRGRAIQHRAAGPKAAPAPQAPAVPAPPADSCKGLMATSP